ncbi:LPS-assembly protein LptD precursor [mine drainage metagenome]|uniref:LPS-assembly protein LptD n=1 Tax=mine drainage metagenome TaxID=410659 RepID=A0A1J5RAJ5_9ZZZZ
MHKNRLYALVFALASAVCGPARAEEDVEIMGDPDNPPTTIEAQHLEIHLDRKMSAIGDAELHSNGEAIFGDRIDYDQLDQALHATGNVRVEQDGNVITGPELKMKLDERVGEMQEAVFSMGGKLKVSAMPGATSGSAATSAYTTAPASSGQSMPSRGSAALLTFDGPNKEVLKDVSYTTCEEGRDDWYLRAKELTLDHYTQTAKAKDASIEFQGVPVLYTPWFDFPLSHQRQSGFLTPTWATTSSSGIDITLPYYWNIAPNMDATISTRYLSNHGVQMQGEFRYLEANYSGEDHVEYLPNDSNGTGNRYYINLSHNQNFGGGWSGGFNYQRVSDSQYFTDLSSAIITTSTVVMPQEAHISYNDDIWHLNALAQKFQTLDGVSYPYQELPQVTLTGHKDWDIASGDLYAQWVDFGRDSMAPPAVTANRFTAYPSISLPFGNAFGYVTPKLGMNLTKYVLGGPTAFTVNGVTDNYQSATRALPIFSVDSGLYFDRDFKVIKNSYTQTLEPRLYYVYIPYQDQSRMPVFDSALADVNLGTLFSENQFTGGDRVNDANQLSFALTSRLIDKETGVQRLAVTVGERYYFSGQRVTLPGYVTPGTLAPGTILAPGTVAPGMAQRNGNTSDIVIAATAHLLNHVDIDTGWQYNTSTALIDQANVGARYSPEPGKVLNLSYRYTRAPLGIQGVNQVDFSGEWPLGGYWYGLGRLNYSFYSDPTLPGGTPGMVESLAGVEYDAGCWQARTILQLIAIPTFPTAANPIPPANANIGHAIFFQLVLNGLGPFGTASPFALIKRSIPGYTNSALIPNNSY